ncbi:competence type IV pilus ATPase ComGA [Limosilactobacillus frumenti]|uniref:competence type IV pilus ATPase ComGA n=1 Tax=Limosilactobacillus frumenti TaxID=104955 RepID=UPI0015EB78B7|nr:competence type IV pilus ATPase ComGA [Limosilactobacillus frumenti]MBA2914521.1 Flp pilus assembly complex ATPase component TadA [Limosilactobacillus frumenti]
MRLIQNLMDQLIADQYSDLYILPNENGYQLLAMPKNQSTWKLLKQVDAAQGRQIISFFKYCANMTTSEHRRPQGGSWRWQGRNHQPVDLRLSTIGDFLSRESLVIRFIYQLDIHQYQVAFPDQWTELQQLTVQRGLILFAGPMGSGKTTTMYRLAGEQANRHLVMTIEDPIEIRDSRFLQLQINRAAGMDYQALLTAGLRHHPNTFIIGEIRDHETAEMAIQASLSGHLVLATIHARNAKGVIARLQDLKIDHYYLDESLTGICYQRLLPLMNGQSAVLFEMLYGTQLIKQLAKPEIGGISNDWQEKLTQLQTQKQIGRETLKRFWQG